MNTKIIISIIILTFRKMYCTQFSIGTDLNGILYDIRYILILRILLYNIWCVLMLQILYIQYILYEIWYISMLRILYCTRFVSSYTHSIRFDVNNSSIEFVSSINFVILIIFMVIIIININIFCNSTSIGSTFYII